MEAETEERVRRAAARLAALPQRKLARSPKSAFIGALSQQIKAAKANGYSYSEIAENLSAEYGEPISEHTVRAAMGKRSSRRRAQGTPAA